MLSTKDADIIILPNLLANIDSVIRGKGKIHTNKCKTCKNIIECRLG